MTTVKLCQQVQYNRKQSQENNKTQQHLLHLVRQQESPAKFSALLEATKTFRNGSTILKTKEKRLGRWAVDAASSVGNCARLGNVHKKSFSAARICQKLAASTEPHLDSSAAGKRSRWTQAPPRSRAHASPDKTNEAKLRLFEQEHCYLC